MIQKLLRNCFVMIAVFLVLRVDAVAQKPWTFLVYMAAANDLNPFVSLDLQEMMEAGSNANINIIVYLTMQEEDQPKITKKLYIKKGSMRQIGESMVRDSGDAATLQEALQWACVDYPADHMAVVLWSHGSGLLNRKKVISKGVCYDFDTGHYLTDCDCLQAFAWARDALRCGKKFDVIAFDAPLLASLEMAYTLSSCANYMIASEGTVPGRGYEYAHILHQFETKSCEPLFLAQSIVNAYKQEDIGILDNSLSATDLNGLQPLVDNCNAIAQILKNQLLGKHREVVKATIKKCLRTNICPKFDEGAYIDLCSFYKNLLQNIPELMFRKSVAVRFQQLLNNGIQLFTDIIKANVMSIDYAQLGGLSIYFSRGFIDPSYYGLYWTGQNPNWLQFLEALLE